MTCHSKSHITLMNVPNLKIPKLEIKHTPVLLYKKWGLVGLNYLGVFISIQSGGYRY